MAATKGVEKSAGDGKSAVVHIVYVDRPEGEDPEAFHIRTLVPIVGSAEAVKQAVIYHYKHAASDFQRGSPRSKLKISRVSKSNI